MKLSNDDPGTLPFNQYHVDAIVECVHMHVHVLDHEPIK